MPVSILAGLQEAKFLPGIKGLIGALPCPVRNTIDVFTGTGSAQEIKAMQCSMTVRNNGVVSVTPFGGVTAPTGTGPQNLQFLFVIVSTIPAYGP